MNIMALLREPFRAMGTTCAISVTTRPGDARRGRAALAAARMEVRACEHVLSRFEPESDLSRLNNACGEWLGVDARLLEALTEAVGARIDTEGRYDPTILPVLVAAGYDRSFEKLVDRPAFKLAGWGAGGRIYIDREQSRARLEV